MSAEDSAKQLTGAVPRMEEMHGKATRSGVHARFGVPGRAVAETLSRQEMPFCVIELNAQTVHRCVVRRSHHRRKRR